MLKLEKKEKVGPNLQFNFQMKKFIGRTEACVLIDGVVKY